MSKDLFIIFCNTESHKIGKSTLSRKCKMIRTLVFWGTTVFTNVNRELFYYQSVISATNSVSNKRLSGYQDASQDFLSQACVMSPCQRAAGLIRVPVEQMVIKSEGQVELILFPAVHPCCISARNESRFVFGAPHYFDDACFHPQDRGSSTLTSPPATPDMMMSAARRRESRGWSGVARARPAAL